MSQKISTILFDADGVLQYPGVDYKLAFSKLLGPRINEAEQFFADIFLAEQESLAGHGDFRLALTALLDRWNLLLDADQLLNISTQIKSSTPMISIIRTLRFSGYKCCLASNQQAHRAQFMSETLGYAKLFDREFYSCDVGFVKPDLRYFQSVVYDLDDHPDSILFIDDQESCVDAARSAGLNGVLFSSAVDTCDQALKKILVEYGISIHAD